MQIEFVYTKAAIQQAMKQVIDLARRNLAVTKPWLQNDGKTRSKKIDTTGKLWKSLKVTELSESDGVFFCSFEMEDYGKFIDQGVSGTRYRTPKPSPFRFKNEGVGVGMQYAIFEWMRAKRIRLRDTGTGRFKKGKITSKSYESLAYVIARSIKRKGINQTFFFSKPLDSMDETLPEILADAFMKDFETYLKKS